VLSFSVSNPAQVFIRHKTNSYMLEQQQQIKSVKVDVVCDEQSG